MENDFLKSRICFIGNEELIRVLLYFENDVIKFELADSKKVQRLKNPPICCSHLIFSFLLFSYIKNNLFFATATIMLNSVKDFQLTP